MTYQARNGKQYVVIAAGGSNRFRMIAGTAEQTADSLIAFSLPDAQTTQSAPRPPTRALRTRMSEAEMKAPGPPLAEGQGKEAVVRMCTTCHGTAVFSKMRMGRIGWEDEVVSMVEKGAKGSSGEIRQVVDYLVSHFGPAPR